MECIRKTMIGSELSGIFEIPPIMLDKMVEIIILPVENETEVISNYKVNLGFLKGVIPPLPDSFFDPLPEEDLQAWGL